MTESPLWIATEKKRDSGSVINYYISVVCPGHTGGTATCTEKAKCEKCGAEYGEPKGHVWGDWTKVDEENHTRTCKRGCGATETVAHVWNGSHWCGYARKCKDCGEFYGEVLDHEYWYEYKTDEQHKINCYHCDTFFGREDHSGGTATCSGGKICELCGGGIR